MSNKQGSDGFEGKQMIYQIRVRGHIGPQWADQFAGFRILHETNGDTVLSGMIVDQAELHGILRKVRDLGVLLLSVNSEGDAG